MELGEPPCAAVVVHPSLFHCTWCCQEGSFYFSLLFFASCRNDPAQLHDDGEMPGPSSAEQEVKFWKEADTSPTNWLQNLPSFISLQSSASPGDQGCKVEKEEDEPEDEPGRKRLLCFCSRVLRAAPIHRAGELSPRCSPWVLVGSAFLMSCQTS